MMNTRSNSNSTPLFTIIIPMKNADKYIYNALESISNQGFHNIEVIVVDDNSDETDISKYLVRSWGNHNPNIKWRLLQSEKNNGGPGGARNVGIDNATGKYLLFLDADDILNNNALKSINNAIEKNPNTDVFVLGYQLIRRDSKENDLMSLKMPAGKLQETRLFQIGADTAGMIWNTCIKKELFGDKDDINNIRFKPNCIFSDLPTKVLLFIRNKKRIKSIPAITHTQYSRPNKSVTGTISLKDLKRLYDAHCEILNYKNTEQTDLKDRIYIDARKISFIGVASWLISKAARNKIDFSLDKIDLKKKELKSLQDEITLGM